MRRLVAAGSCCALLVGACTSGDDAPDPQATVARFVDAWPRDGEDLAETVTGGDASRLLTTLRAIGRGGVVRAELARSSPAPDAENTIRGTVTLVFADDGQLELTIEAAVDGGRVRAHPSAVSTQLQGWEPLRIDAFGDPERGDILSRSGSLLARGPQDARAPARPELAPVVTLIDDALDVPLGGQLGRRLLAGDPERTIAESDPHDGVDVTTSLDDEMQATADAGLAGRPGALVVVDPSTGGIRALASSPEPSHPELLPATSPYSPGSAFKIVTAAAALESGAFEADDMVPCPARMSLGERSITNFEGLAYGSITFERAFAVSCNTAFAHIGITTGTEALLTTAQALGFRAVPELDGAGTIAVPRSRAELGVWAFGAAGSLVSPVQMAGLGSTIARGGLAVSPGWIDDPAPGERVLRATTAEALVEMMEEVVRSGTGQGAAAPGFQVAGKTGTADPRPGGTRPDAWFVGLAPSQDTRVVAVALVPGGGLGGELPASLVRAFFLATGGG